MSTPLRVLFVEDSEDDMRMLVRQLRQGGYAPVAERIETADGLRAALHRKKWEIIIADYSMPRFSGLEALAVTLQLAPEIPFLMVSGTVGEEVAVESINAGAADYLMKQNLIRFVPAVARAMRDTTERKAMNRQEAAIREQRSLLGMIYDNTSDAIILNTWEAHGAAWVVRSVNRATLNMIHGLGIDVGEDAVLGKKVEEVIENLLHCAPSEASALLEDFYTTAESGRPRTRESQLAVGKSTLFVEMTLIPFFGPDGSTRHVLAVARDISSRKRAEEARREFEARLAQSRKMEALGQLAGGVAHDFNNILAGILGFADVIRRTTKDTATTGFSNEIIQAATRARDLIRQILMFSRRQPAERKPVRLAAIAREALQLVQSASPASVQFDIRLAEDTPYIMGDATQLHQVVMNLSTNAVQAMGEGGGTLEVAVEAIEVTPGFALRHPPLREGPSVRLRITDTGPGMPQAVLDRLFEPFFTTKAPGVGTGLGLSVVHGVVQNHQGAIVVESRPGNGTTFEVHLPAVNSSSWSGDAPMTNASTSGNGQRILFVDDEAPITRLAEVMLKAVGHTPSTFGRAADALAALEANPQAFDLIITDLTMPEMTGVDFARGIRAIRGDIPIILSSGYADEVSEKTLKELGIVEVLPKPFQLQSLGAAIARAAVDKSRSDRGPDSYH